MLKDKFSSNAGSAFFFLVFSKNRSEEVVVKPKLAVIAAALLKQVGSFHVTVLIVDQAQCWKVSLKNYIPFESYQRFSSAHKYTAL